MREGDGLEMMVERWRRRMERMGSVVRERMEPAVREKGGEVLYVAHSGVYQGEEEKKDRPQRSSR